MKIKDDLEKIQQEMAMVGVRYVRGAMEAVLDEIEQRFRAELTEAVAIPPQPKARIGRPPIKKIDPIKELETLPQPAKRKVSVTGRRAMAAAQKKRWAKHYADKRAAEAAHGT